MFHVLVLPGHGGHDRGTHGTNPDNGNPVFESRANLNTALRFREKMHQTGQVQVTMSRETDVYVSPSAQLAMAKSRRWDAVIAFHYNGAADPKANGAEILHNDDPESERLADTIAAQFKARGFKLRHEDGTFVSPRSLALKKCKNSPVIYVEPAFLTGPDIEKVNTLTEQWAVANDVAYGTLIFLGVIV